MTGPWRGLSEVERDSIARQVLAGAVQFESSLTGESEFGRDLWRRMAAEHTIKIIRRRLFAAGCPARKMAGEVDAIAARVAELRVDA